MHFYIISNLNHSTVIILIPLNVYIIIINRSESFSIWEILNCDGKYYKKWSSLAFLVFNSTLNVFGLIINNTLTPASLNPKIVIAKVTIRGFKFPIKGIVQNLSILRLSQSQTILFIQGITGFCLSWLPLD